MAEQSGNVIEGEALRYYPFGDDFGRPDDRTLRDQFVNVRKRHACHLCGGVILRGERARRMVALFERALHDYRWCWKCCAAMAASWSDAGKRLERRARLLRTRKPTWLRASCAWCFRFIGYRAPRCRFCGRGR